MTKTIWKFELNGRVEMPVGAKILCCQSQKGVACLWALVNPEGETEDRRFIVHGTGHPVPDESERYIDTYQELGGALIWHVFEKVQS